MADNQCQTFYTEGGYNKVVLLIHGLTGAPSEMRTIAKLLQKDGFSSYTPLIKGHGSDVTALLKTTWQDWYHGLEAELELVYKKYGPVYIAGLCAGGSLGLLLAKNYPHMVKAVAVYSPILSYNGWNMPFYYSLANTLLNTTLKFLPPLSKLQLKECYPFGIKNKKLRNFMLSLSHKDSGIIESYPLKTLNDYLKLVKIVKKSLPFLKTPLLLVQSIYDDVSSYKSALYMQKYYGGICDIHLLNDSYHLINIDQQKEMVAKQTSLFFNHYS